MKQRRPVPPNIWICNVFVNSFAKATNTYIPKLSIEQKLAQWNVFANVKKATKLDYDEMAGMIVYAFVVNPLKLKNVAEYGVLDYSLYKEVALSYIEFVEDKKVLRRSYDDPGDYLNAAIQEINKYAQEQALSKRIRNIRKRSQRFRAITGKDQDY